MRWRSCSTCSSVRSLPQQPAPCVSTSARRGRVQSSSRPALASRTQTPHCIGRLRQMNMCLSVRPIRTLRWYARPPALSETTLQSATSTPLLMCTTTILAAPTSRPAQTAAMPRTMTSSTSFCLIVRQRGPAQGLLAATSISRRACLPKSPMWCRTAQAPALSACTPSWMMEALPRTKPRKRWWRFALPMRYGL